MVLIRLPVLRIANSFKSPPVPSRNAVASSITMSPRSSFLPTHRRHTYEHDHDERRDDYLLQGLGRGPGHHLLAWLAAQRGRLGRSAAVPRPERFPRDRTR